MTHGQECNISRIRKNSVFLLPLFRTLPLCALGMLFSAQRHTWRVASVEQSEGRQACNCGIHSGFDGFCQSKAKVSPSRHVFNITGFTQSVALKSLNSETRDSSPFKGQKYSFISILKLLKELCRHRCMFGVLTTKRSFFA